MAKNAKDFNCDDCRNDYHCTNRANDPNWPKSRGAAPFVILEIPGVVESRVCLKPLITQESREFIRLYDHYKSSKYPYSGGLYEQPAQYLEAMEVIESAASRTKPKPKP